MSGRRVNNQGVGAVRGMFMFALLAAFAVLSVMVVLVGARVYRAVESRGSENYGTRTVLSYLAGKVRACDAAGSVGTAELDGVQALMLTADYGGEAYATYIYACDGQLLEYFGKADRAFEPAYGESIAAADGFSAAWDGKLLVLTVTDETGQSHELSLYVQSGEAEA